MATRSAKQASCSLTSSQRAYVRAILFAADHIDPRREALMNVVDAINHSGKLGKVYFAARGHRDLSSMIKRERLSPRYTTNLAELPVVKA